MRYLLVTLFALFPLLLLSHGGGHPTRYVAASGQDIGECGDANSPCASIAYAVGKSAKGDTIVVASGDYDVDELDVFYLLSDMVTIKGGYHVSDGFKTQKPETNVSTIRGVPAEYRERLASRGFRLLQDTKGQELGLSTTQKTWLKTYSKLTSEKVSATACEDGFAGANECHNIDRVSHTPLAEFTSQPSSANDIWGFVDLNTNKEYAIIGVLNGTTVFDLSDAENPIEVGHISGAVSTWRDIKVYQYFDDAADAYKAYAYVTTEGVQGLQILDLNNLASGVTLAATLVGDFVSAHNVYIANVDYATGVVMPGFEPFLYIAGSNRSGGVFLTYTLTNPVLPELVSEGSSGYVHDTTTFIIDDARTAACAPGHSPCEILVDFNENTVDIWDMTDKNAPSLISETSYTQVGYVHSGWWSQDKQTIFVQDELDERDSGLNTTLRAMDISDLLNPEIVGTYTGPTRAIDHNGFTVGDYYYMSNYRRGLTVIDVSDPTDMTEVGFFDTFAVPEENSASFNGAWGAYPFLPSGNIIVSDIEYGLWILKLNENDGSSPPPSPAPSPAPQPPINIDSGGGGALSLAMLLFLGVGCLISGRFNIRKSKN